MPEPPGVRKVAGRARHHVRRAIAGARGPQPHPDVLRVSDEDMRAMSMLYDDTVPLPPGADEQLQASNPRLLELRAAYDAMDAPVRVSSRWHEGAVESFLDLRYFRGETLFVWHYRELPRITALKYFLFAQYVHGRDTLGLLGRLEEDGAFGCFTFDYEGYGTFSRDLLEATNEIGFLERRLGVSQQRDLRILDIGAGYGRLAHRVCASLPNVVDYCCVDAVPEATFLSEWYLRFRGVAPPARVVALTDVDRSLEPGSFDLAVNIHSFSECTYGAIAWWVARLERLQVPRLLIVPNEPSQLLSLETDGSRRDYMPLLEAAGYRLDHREPVIEDPAIRQLVDLHDSFHLFVR